MTEQELSAILSKGESRTVEFKKSIKEITKNVYETVCSFSNRDGGDILLGVADDGTVLGVDPSCADKIKKNLVTSINNPRKYIRRCTFSHRTFGTANALCFMFLFPHVRKCAAAADEFMTAIMIQMWILPMLPTSFTSCMHKNRILSM